MKKLAIVFFIVVAIFPLMNIELSSSQRFQTLYSSNEMNKKVQQMDSYNKVDPKDSESDYSSTLVLVNKEHALPQDFTPGDLVVPDVRFSFSADLPKKQMRKEAAEALEGLFRQAVREGIDLVAVSGFRSYDRQAEIFANAVRLKGESKANAVSARPGQSEHQTGLAMDVSSGSVDYKLVAAFGDTVEGAWLARTAPSYGYLVRYPKGKEHLTGYQYEPWHIRYVGVKHAKTITQYGLTLEEYLYDWS